MNQKQKVKLFKIIISFLLLICAFLIKIELYQSILFLFAFFIVGYDILLKACRNILCGHVFDENFLMSIATIGAFGIGEFEEAVAVMLFYQIGELFQSYAVDKSRKSVASLMDIRPDYANVSRDGKVKKVSPDEVNVGEIILIKPGEKVPLDGIVVEGETLLNTIALTGESVPRRVTLDSEVLSGCINVDGVLKVSVAKEFGESTVSKILDLVENASSRKSKSENFIHKFAKVYTPIVVFIALIIAVFPPILIKDALFMDYLHRALSFLVVSCPCALVISVPLSFFGGIGAASRSGILIKGSNYLEGISHTEIVACDKTGTLTEGVFKVQKIDAIGYSDEELLKNASHAEMYSNHPISISLKQAYSKKLKESLVRDAKEISGKGVSAIVDGKEVFVGNEKLMREKHISYKKCEEIGTVVYVAIDKKFAGTILISDKIKEDSYKAVELLKKENVKKIVLLTGDDEKVSKQVREALKLQEYHAGLLPQDKVMYVETLLKEKSHDGKLVFLGDGVNDAPVLALSDIGVAMGALGSDAAIESADIVIMTDEPSKLADAIFISKKTMRIVRENILFALSIKIGVLVLSALGLSNMWMAVFADVGVTVLAILNSMRMLRVKL